MRASDLVLEKNGTLVDGPPSLLQDYAAWNLAKILDQEASGAVGRNFEYQANRQKLELANQSLKKGRANRCHPIFEE